MAGKLSTSGSNFEDSSSQSVLARHLIENRSGVSPDIGLVALVRLDANVNSPTARAHIQQLARTITHDADVARVYDLYNTGGDTFVSHDRRSTYLAVAFKPISDSEAETAAKRVQKSLSNDPTVTVGGAVLGGSEVGSQVGKDLGMAEGFAFPILFILLFLVFRSVVAALLPLLGGVVAILGTFLGLRIVNGFTPMSIFALNLGDRSLGRARNRLQPLHRLSLPGGARPPRPRPGGARADTLDRREDCLLQRFDGGRRACLAARLSAAVPSTDGHRRDLRRALLSRLASIVLPAMLMVLGPRVNALSPARFRRGIEQSAQPDAHGFWSRLARTVMRRPILFAVGSAAVMIALGIPFLGIKFTGVDAGDLPKSASARAGE